MSTQVWVKNVILWTKGDELTELKTLCDFPARPPAGEGGGSNNNNKSVVVVVVVVVEAEAGGVK